jgi:hypothetical protein
MRHLNLEIEKLEQRIAPGGLYMANHNGSGSKSHSKSKDHSKTNDHSKSKDHSKSRSKSKSY